MKIKNILKEIKNFNFFNSVKIYIRNKKTRVWLKLVKENKSVTKKIYKNLKITLYPNSILSKMIFFDNFEKKELEFLKFFLKKGDSFIDIGANIGLFSLLASKHVTNKGKVFAFEPTPDTLNKLNENIKLNNIENIIVQEFALSDSNDDKEFFMSIDGYDAWNSLTEPKDWGKFKKIIVKSSTFDTWVNTQNIDLSKVKLIKIDVEGWEFPLLKGAIKTLSQQNAPALLIEFTEENAKNAGFTCISIYNLLLDYGYKFYDFDATKKEIYPIETPEEFNYINLIALKN